jgi:hypothetical protein
MQLLFHMRSLLFVSFDDFSRMVQSEKQSDKHFKLVWGALKSWSNAILCSLLLFLGAKVRLSEVKRYILIIMFKLLLLLLTVVASHILYYCSVRERERERERETSGREGGGGKYHAQSQIIALILFFFRSYTLFFFHGIAFNKPILFWLITSNRFNYSWTLHFPIEYIHLACYGYLENSVHCMHGNNV